MTDAVGMDWTHYHRFAFNFFEIPDTSTMNRLATIYSWMEKLAARFPHLVSLKVSNLFLLVPLKVSNLLLNYRFTNKTDGQKQTD